MQIFIKYTNVITTIIPNEMIMFSIIIFIYYSEKMKIVNRKRQIRLSFGSVFRCIEFVNSINFRDDCSFVDVMNGY